MRPPLPEVRSPTVRRRELGALLRALRSQKGLTVEQVADRLLCSPSKVSRMETGHGIATPRDIRDLCDLYEVTDEAERDRMSRLARESKQQGWWQSYGLEFDTYVGLEAAASATKYYQSTVIPGLLQTADYARAMHEVVIPRLPSSRIEELVQVRMTRQHRLTQDPPLQTSAVLDEAALRRMVGGRLVMRTQLDWLVAVARRPNVTIHIIPYTVGAHPAMDSTFRILEFSGSVPAVVYVEGLVGGIYLDRPSDISRYQEIFQSLCSIALSPQDSIGLVAKVIAEYESALISLADLKPAARDE
jgi:transcriptional regulator with XRE-family HTH domain